MSASTNTQDIFRRILRTRQEAHQLLYLIQKISADMASEKVQDTKEYLDVLEKIFNDVPTFLVFDNVPVPDSTPRNDQGNWYDIGIAMDGSLWWKDLTGWVKIWDPVQTVHLIKGDTEVVTEFPDDVFDGDVIYTPKGSVYQYKKEDEEEEGIWELIHQAYLVELTTVVDGTALQNNYGKDNDIVIDNKLSFYQKKEGVWVLITTLQTYTKTEIDQLLNPQTVQFEYDGSDNEFELPSNPKGIYMVYINQTPLFLNAGFTVSGNKVTITYSDKYVGDIVTIIFI